MNVRRLLRAHLESALAGLAPADQTDKLAEMLVPSQDPKFGDYQINCAMALGKTLQRPPREVAQEIAGKLSPGELGTVEPIAGPGFINLKLSDAWLAAQLQSAVSDERLNIAPTTQPKSYVVDYSGPNVAKPMHVGHIRSTVIGDAIYRTLKFLGHKVIGDNHLGDWGTQFGMIIYGYKHFLDKAAYEKAPLDELARLYRHVRRIMDYFESKRAIGPAQEKYNDRSKLAATLTEHLRDFAPADKTEKKSLEKQTKKALDAQTEALIVLNELQTKLQTCMDDPKLMEYAKAHPDIESSVLAETVKLHKNDPENMRLWNEFMPVCRIALDVVYRRLGVTFDEELGESFYHSQLQGIVDELSHQPWCRESEGALCIFLNHADANVFEYDVPMIIRKKDGAFLYATTDLATIKYRMDRLWKEKKYDWPRAPDKILYVVDHRQSLHFAQLFDTARQWGYEHDPDNKNWPRFQHLSFGTVLGKDGKPYKTRSGDTVGLMGLLDDAVEQAHKIVSDNDDRKPNGAELDAETRKQVAETVGIGAIKYADLSQNRTSDYEFSYDKMLAMSGNTATYMQYAYARVRSIFRRGGFDAATLRAGGAKITLGTPAERALGVALLRFEEALELSLVDFRPNLLTTYLFDLANAYSTFFEQCPVLKAPSEEIRDSRLLLCDLTARTIRTGLSLLGIDVVEQM